MDRDQPVCAGSLMGIEPKLSALRVDIVSQWPARVSGTGGSPRGCDQPVCAGSLMGIEPKLSALRVDIVSQWPARVSGTGGSPRGCDQPVCAGFSCLSGVISKTCLLIPDKHVAHLTLAPAYPPDITLSTESYQTITVYTCRSLCKRWGWGLG